MPAPFQGSISPPCTCFWGRTRGQGMHRAGQEAAPQPTGCDAKLTAPGAPPRWDEHPAEPLPYAISPLQTLSEASQLLLQPPACRRPDKCRPTPRLPTPGTQLPAASSPRPRCLEHSDFFFPICLGLEVRLPELATKAPFSWAVCSGPCLCRRPCPSCCCISGSPAWRIFPVFFSAGPDLLV